MLHGETNPPVSCSTPQSAAFALVGKLAALGHAMETGPAQNGAMTNGTTQNGTNGATYPPYLGDVHVEPHHGTNLSGVMSLAEAARWAERQQAVVA